MPFNGEVELRLKDFCNLQGDGEKEVIEKKGEF